MLDQNVITLLATALGGALALIGGIIATYFTQMLNNRAERRRFVREKCEEVYILADQVKRWADNEDLKWWYNYHKEFEPDNSEIYLYGSKRILEPIECPIDRLIMIVALHIPELRTKAQALKGVIDIYQTYLDYFPEQGWEAFSGDVDLVLRDTDQKLKDAHLELKLLIEKTVLKSWGMQLSRNNNRTKKFAQKDMISADRDMKLLN